LRWRRTGWEGGVRNDIGPLRSRASCHGWYYSVVCPGLFSWRERLDYIVAHQSCFLLVTQRKEPRALVLWIKLFCRGQNLLFLTASMSFYQSLIGPCSMPLIHFWYVAGSDGHGGGRATVFYRYGLTQDFVVDRGGSTSQGASISNINNIKVTPSELTFISRDVLCSNVFMAIAFTITHFLIISHTS